MKNCLLKTILVIAVTTFATLHSHAQQKGDMGVGAGLVLGSGDDYSNMGLEAKFLWNVTDRIRVAPAFTYFFEKDYVSMWDLSVYGHYLFPVGSGFTLYPLAGLGVLGAKSELLNDWMDELEGYGIDTGTSASSSEFAFALGGGADYELTEKWSLNAELKFKFASGWNRTLISFGAAYRF